MDYNSFAKECVEELKITQRRFNENYDIDGYENWFYNQATALLTFSTGETELNFKYFEVGSFSNKSNTWMWSWANDHILENVKENTKQIREFGKNFNFTKFTDGCFQSDEFEAWEFAAIAVRLTSGIGIYRPVNDGLKIFLVVTEFIDNRTARKIKDKYVKCGTHEYKRVAFVCKHLNFSTKVGFEEAFETFEGMELSDDNNFQAWCDSCEAVRFAEGGWNENTMTFAQIKIVCEECYFIMKALNLGYR